MLLDGPSDGPIIAVTSQITSSSLELRAWLLAYRKLADERALKLGYLGYTGHFDVRPRSSSVRASECSKIGLQKALFEPYTAQCMQAWCWQRWSRLEFCRMRPTEWCVGSSDEWTRSLD